MHPETARAILLAMQNHYRPPRTTGAKVRDALQHVQTSGNKKPAEQGGLKDICNNERTSHSTLPSAKNHPAEL